ncbi:MAG: hypothetical protein NUW24_11660 [Anaerolineae bacterium]|nr:hypothetical protein [Anaerolineae bacterium]MDH7475661.1 hypothetical protein [Anaerolineae bacterium]
MENDETRVISEVASEEAGEVKPTPAPRGKLPKNLVSIIAGIIVIALICVCLAVAGGGYYVYNQGLLAGIGIGTKPSVKVVQGYMADSIKSMQAMRKAYEPLLKYLAPDKRDKWMIDFPAEVKIDKVEYKILEESTTKAVINVKGEYSITQGGGEETVTKHGQLDETITVIKADDGKWYLSEMPDWWPPYR